MAQVAISSEAIAELRGRVAREMYAAGVVILGPMGPDCRMPGDDEEAHHLDIVYGPAPRWVLHVQSLNVLDRLRENAHFLTLDVDGLRIVVAGAKLKVTLRVELHGESIRISEHDA